MSKGKSLKKITTDIKRKIEIKGIEYDCKLDMNALAELEDIYGDFQLAFARFKEKPNTTVRAIIYAVIKKEYAEKACIKESEVTIGEIGSLIELKDLSRLCELVGQLINDSFPEATENIEELEELEELEETEEKK
ncbi:MAG: hypothetical protein RR662_03815 [Clostridia bacterium]